MRKLENILTTWTKVTSKRVKNAAPKKPKKNRHICLRRQWKKSVCLLNSNGGNLYQPLWKANICGIHLHKVVMCMTRTFFLNSYTSKIILIYILQIILFTINHWNQILFNFHGQYHLFIFLISILEMIIW